MSADHSTSDPDPAITLPPAAAPLTLPQANALPAADRVNVPGYEIVGELGRGGMGVVYKARQVGLNRDVALKMILAGGHASATDLARFKSEAAAVAKLQHPNVVQVYEVGEAGGLPYFSLEFCPGGSLEKMLAGTPQPPREAAALIETLARAVRAAHQAGIVHRDLKPANVLLSFVPGPLSLARNEGIPVLQGTKDKEQVTIPKITDFGLAKQIDSGSGRTASGAILGTPSYMAPEQANSAKEIGPAADTYALGAILYELLTGRPPFRAATNLDTILQVVGSDPVPPTRLNPQVPRDLETIALKCLQKEPAKRYASAAALADDLHRWQAGEPIAARPAGAVEKAIKWAKRRPAVAMLSAAVVLAIAGGFSGVLYELRIANDARTRADGRADDLAKEQVRVRRELHNSDLLRTDLLLQGSDFLRAEQLLWRSHFTRPDHDDRRAFWRLWELYHQRPRRSGAWIAVNGMSRLSGDGRWVTAIGDNKFTIYDAFTGNVRSRFQAPKDEVEEVFFSPDGNRVALLFPDDGSIAVWDLDPAPTLRATLPPISSFRSNALTSLGGALFELPKEQVQKIQRVSFFAQTRLCFLAGDRVLVAGPDKAALWNLNGPAVIAQCDLERGPTSPFVSGGGGANLPLAARGDTLSVICGGVVQLWDLPRTAAGSIVRTRLDFTDPARIGRVPARAAVNVGPERGEAWPGSALLTADGKWLVTTGKRRLRVWDVATGAKLGELQDGEPSFVGPIYSLAPDGRAIRCVDGDGIRLWRLPKLELMGTVKTLEGAGYGLGAVFGRGGSQTVGTGQNAIAVYDHEPAEAVHSLLPPNFREQVPFKDIAATGPAIGTDFKGLSVWRDGRADRIAISPGFGGGAGHTFISANGSLAIHVQSGLFGASVTIYDLTTRRVTANFSLRDPEGRSVRFLGLAGGVISPDGHTLAIRSMNGVELVDLIGKKVVRSLRDNEYSEFLFTPDGRAVLCRITDANVLAQFSVADGRELARSPAPTEWPLAISRDGMLFLTRGDRRLVLRNPSTLAVVGEIPATADDHGCAAFAPDGQIVATGSSDGKLRLWDMKRREEMAAIDLGAGNISKVVFTPDGSKVRFVAEKQVGELDLRAFDPYVEGNLTWNLLRLLPDLDRTEAERVLERLRETHPDAYRAGNAAMPSPR